MFPQVLHIYGPIAIQSYGLMILIALATFMLITYNHPRRKALINGEVYINGIFLSLLAGIIGARLLYVITFWDKFVGNWLDLVCPWTGGFLSLGSIIGVLVFAPWYLKKHKVPVLPLLDFIVIYVPILQAIARVGCFLAGCCYGCKASPSLPWHVIFTYDTGYLPPEYLWVPLHPAQFYASAASLVVFLILYFVAQRLLNKPGQLLFAYLALESVARFVTDFWRGDRGECVAIGEVSFSVFQMYSLLFLAITIIGFLIVTARSNRQRNNIA